MLTECDHYWLKLVAFDREPIALIYEKEEREECAKCKKVRSRFKFLSGDFYTPWEWMQ